MKRKSWIICGLIAAWGLLAPAVLMAAERVNVNTATIEELQAVKGIGEATARRIVDYRQAHGDFKSLDELSQVKGIGEKKAEKLANQLSVGAAKGKLAEKERKKQQG